MEGRILSVGIDVGTTTFHLVVASFEVVNTAPPLQAPSYEIRNRQILYPGTVHPTPLKGSLGGETLDLERLTEGLRQEYETAGIAPEQVQTGAVIVTGLSARRENAQAIVKALAMEAGGSVATAAGPRLEAVLAGRGAGAEERSKTVSGPVLNVDVGGGTANLALFENGNVVKSGALYVGGRLARLRAEAATASFQIDAVSDPYRFLAHRLGLPTEGNVSLPETERLCMELAAVLDRFVFTERVTSRDAQLWLTEPLELKRCPEVVTFSGGVAEYIYGTSSERDCTTVARHGDYGPLLGQTLRGGRLASQCRLELPQQTIRATVLGVGAHLVQISGSTVSFEGSSLPLHDVPVVIFPPDGVETLEKLVTGARSLELEGDGPFAIAVPGLKPLSFYQTRQVAEIIVAALDRLNYPQNVPVVLLCEGDSGNILGETVAMLRRDVPVVALDRIAVSPGDCVDIAGPVTGARIIPVTVKTLVFAT